MHNIVGIRTDAVELGGWDTPLFVLEKKNSHLWVGTLALPAGIQKKQNGVVVFYKYLLCAIFIRY